MSNFQTSLFHFISINNDLLKLNKITNIQKNCETFIICDLMVVQMKSHQI